MLRIYKDKVKQNENKHKHCSRARQRERALVNEAHYKTRFAPQFASNCSKGKICISLLTAALWLLNKWLDLYSKCNFDTKRIAEQQPDGSRLWQVDCSNTNHLKSNCHLQDFLSTAQFFVAAKEVGQNLWDISNISVTLEETSQLKIQS